MQVQLDNYVDHAIIVQDEIIYFMKEGTVHQPEVFEMVLKGYNIDTSDYVINTEHNIRFAEPNHNHWAKVVERRIFKNCKCVYF